MYDKVINTPRGAKFGAIGGDVPVAMAGSIAIVVGVVAGLVVGAIAIVAALIRARRVLESDPDLVITEEQHSVPSPSPSLGLLTVIPPAGAMAKGIAPVQTRIRPEEDHPNTADNKNPAPQTL